jgi:hypothetical protein
MQNQPSQNWRNILTNIKTITATASELGRTAIKRVDEARDGTGGALHTVASSVRTTGRKSSKAIDSLATGTADRLDATASYLKHHDLGDVFTGVRRFSLRHLTGSMVVAAAIGFIAGAAISRVTHFGETAAPSAGSTTQSS